MIALVGVLPSESSPIAFGGSSNLIARWDRWVTMSREAFWEADPYDTRIWNFTAASGVFEEMAVAGAWRLSQTRNGLPLPLAVLCCGKVPSPTDPWFTAAAQVLSQALTGAAKAARLRDQVSALPGFTPTPPIEQGACFWIDDWEVHELVFADIHELAETGFSQMLAPRLVTEGDA